MAAMMIPIDIDEDSRPTRTTPAFALVARGTWATTSRMVRRQLRRAGFPASRAVTANCDRKEHQAINATYSPITCRATTTKDQIFAKTF